MTYQLLGLAAVMLGALGTLSACGADRDTATNVTAATTAPSFSGERIKADIDFLASDMLEGRNTGSDGYRIAANYVAARFQHMGLKPAGDAGSYLQEVPFQTALADVPESAMTVTTGGITRKLVYGRDFIVGGSVQNPAGTAMGDLIFAGYGIHAPDEGYDDFADIDVAGKVAVVFTSAPKSLNSETRAHFGSSATKAIALASRGAVGMIQVIAPGARFGFEALKARVTRPSYDWIYPDDADQPVQLKASAVIADALATELFAAAGQDFAAVKLAIEGGAQPPRFDIPSSLSLTRSSVLSDPFTSPNVVAVLEGGDPVLKDEYVVVSAHLDHVGTKIDAQEGEDRVFNGALDNASGVATLLEVAHAYTESGRRPRRSIIFVAVTGEERGLLGAEYFAHFPTVDQRALVANVNLDMPVLLYNFVDVIAFGAERSSLGPIVEAATAKIGIATTPDPLPEQNLFVRSDHYRFVQQGIPSVFLMTGFGVTEDGDNGGDIFKTWLATDYHSVRDQPSLPINYTAARRFAEVNFYILDAIANGDDRPRWNDGDFFGDTFSK